MDNQVNFRNKRHYGSIKVIQQKQKLNSTIKSNLNKRDITANEKDEQKTNRN
jgi:hypothetical protein